MEATPALCLRGCGRRPFRKFPTCCTHCKGASGPHAKDCEAKQQLLIQAEEAAHEALRAEEELASIPDLAGAGLLGSFRRVEEASSEAVKLEEVMKEVEIELRREADPELCADLPIAEPTDPYEEQPELGAYLVYERKNNGQMVLVWSKVAVADALAFGHPRRAVPAFKFAKDGHWELTRNIQSSHRTYYLGWVMFVKACGLFDCTVVDLGLEGDAAPMPTSLWLWQAEGCRITHVKKGEPFSTRAVTVVAAAHSDNTVLNIQALNREFFENKAKEIGECTAMN